MNTAMTTLTQLDRLRPSTQERHVDLGPGLRGVLRIHGAVRVLCVRNVTDDAQSFRPAGYLGGVAAPLFLAGAVTTAGEAGDGLICRLDPRAFVCLASSHPDPQ